MNWLRDRSYVEIAIAMASVAVVTWAAVAWWDGAFAGFSPLGSSDYSRFEGAAGDRQGVWAGRGVVMSVIGLVVVLAFRAKRTVRILVALALVAGAVLSTRYGIESRDRMLHPWPRYERMLATFPTMQGTRLTQRNEGGHTWFELPSVDHVWQTDRSVRDACVAAETALRQWATQVTKDGRLPWCNLRGVKGDADVLVDVRPTTTINVPPGTERPDESQGRVAIRVAMLGT